MAPSDQIELFDSGTGLIPQFDGETYDPERDLDRLSRQLGRVYECLRDGQWWTLERLHSRCACLRAQGGFDSYAGISARIRDLRKIKFGGYDIEHECISRGLWRYRLARSP